MNDYMKAATYNYPERIPIGVSLLPATWRRYGKDLQALCLRHRDIFTNVQDTPDIKYYTPPSYHEGKFTDAWGCVWENIAEGYESIVTGHPLKEREDIRALKAGQKPLGNYPGIQDGINEMKFLAALVENSNGDKKWTKLD